MLAVVALGSMIGWPLYRLIKNVHKRGRLPDMKPMRVTSAPTVVAVVLFVFFFVPLPVTRIREHGFVQVQPTEVAQVTVEVPGILKTVYVVEGQQVKKGQLLAEFAPLFEMENQRATCAVPDRNQGEQQGRPRRPNQQGKRRSTKGPPEGPARQGGRRT